MEEDEEKEEEEVGVGEGWTFSTCRVTAFLSPVSRLCVVSH